MPRPPPSRCRWWAPTWGALPVVLVRTRLLDLEDQVTSLPDLVRRGQDARASGHEVLVGDQRARSGALLDIDLMAVPGQLVHPGWGYRHPVLMILDFLGNPDLRSEER